MRLSGRELFTEELKARPPLGDRDPGDLWSIFAVSRLGDADGPWVLLGLEEQVSLANPGGRLEIVCREVKRPVAAS
jgi:hypothetical protein